MTAVDNNQTSPQNTSNSAATLTPTAGSADSFITQAFSGRTIGEVCTFSVWLRTSTGTNTVNIYIVEGGSSTSTACAVTTTWQRFSVTRTLTTTTPSVQIGGGGTIIDPEITYMYGAQFEVRPWATSYCWPHTTTASMNRYRDCLAMVQPDHNLIPWSNSFDKSTLVRGTSGLWYTTGTFSTTRTAGPDGAHVNAWTWTGGAPANTLFEMTIPNSIYIANGRTVTFSIWIKSAAAAAAGYAMTQYITQTAGTALATRSIVVTSEWQRFTTSVRISNETYDDIRIALFETVGGSRVFEVYGAQVTICNNPFSLNLADTHANPYLDTQSSPVYAADGMSVPRHLAQNGYIEFDVMPHWVPGSSLSPSVTNFTLMENNITAAITGFEGIRVWRDAGFGSGVHTLSARLNSVNSSDRASSDQITAQVTPTTGTIFKNSYTKLRLTWTNYLINGTRTMQLQLQATDSGGTVTTGTAVNATTGHNKWTWCLEYQQDAGTNTRNTVNDLFYFIGAATTALYGANYRNIRFGVPSIPSNAVPEPY